MRSMFLKPAARQSKLRMDGVVEGGNVDDGSVGKIGTKARSRRDGDHLAASGR